MRGIGACGRIGLLLILGFGCRPSPLPASPTILPSPTPAGQPSPMPVSPTAVPAPATPGEEIRELRLRSPAFADGDLIPVAYTCTGADRSPPLRWDAPPPGTRSLALIMDDPDAPGGRFIHWVLYQIPPDRTELPEGVPAEPAVEGIGFQGRNDFGRIGYGGPCPPPGPAHRYRFTLYALDISPDLPPGAGAAAVEQAIQGHIRGIGRLIGRYGR